MKIYFMIPINSTLLFHESGSLIADNVRILIKNMRDDSAYRQQFLTRAGDEKSRLPKPKPIEVHTDEDIAAATRRDMSIERITSLVDERLKLEKGSLLIAASSMEELHKSTILLRKYDYDSTSVGQHLRGFAGLCMAEIDVPDELLASNPKIYEKSAEDPYNTIDLDGLKDLVKERGLELNTAIKIGEIQLLFNEGLARPVSGINMYMNFLSPELSMWRESPALQKMCRAHQQVLRVLIEEEDPKIMAMITEESQQKRKEYFEKHPDRHAVDWEEYWDKFREEKRGWKVSWERGVAKEQYGKYECSYVSYTTFQIQKPHAIEVQEQQQDTAAAAAAADEGKMEGSQLEATQAQVGDQDTTIGHEAKI